MCLILKGPKPPSMKGQHIFYKVYVHKANPWYFVPIPGWMKAQTNQPTIESPFRRTLVQAGTTEIQPPTSAIIEPRKFNGYPVPIEELFRLCKGKLIDIAGLHCIATREEAITFGNYVVEDAISYNRRYPHRTILILPVIVEADDIIAVGRTPLDNRAFGTTLVESIKHFFGFHGNTVSTYVVKKLTISEATFKQALECASDLKLPPPK